MEYKVKCVVKWKTMPNDYEIFYKKWWWLFWKPSGIGSTDVRYLNRIVYALLTERGK